MVNILWRYFLWMLFAGSLCSGAVVTLGAQELSDDAALDSAEVPDFSSLSLEELMEVKISSVTKELLSVSGAPAAAFVITQEDIRRAGVSSIPDALRMVPGVQVVQIDANKWGVSARGFAGRFSNKLLVLIDGRTVYTPLFSGTFWEDQDLVLEDIERIEVIRGPGATLWGANAVNGVINIITKHAGDTQGGLVSTRTGSEDTHITSLRYGGRLGEDTFYRAYVKYKNIDDLVLNDGADASDEWSQIRTGFRIDSELSDQDSLMLQSNFFHTDSYSNGSLPSVRSPFTIRIPFDNEINGVDFTSRWTRTLEDDSSFELQLDYTGTDRELFDVEEDRHTFNLDAQHRFQLMQNHELIWGAGYRFTTDDISSTEVIAFQDPQRDLNLFSFFLQDEITLVQDELLLYLGSKFEHNDFTGFEVQPNARLVWTPNEFHTVWGAVSRAVRTPSRSEENSLNNIFVAGPGTTANPFILPALVQATSASADQAEDLLAFELGYRTVLFQNTSLDLAVFYNLYDDLINGEFGELSTGTFQGENVLLLPIKSVYTAEADSYGVEAALDIQVTDWWSLKPAYSYIQIQAKDVLEFAGAALFHDDKLHQVSLRSQMNFPHEVEIDLWLRYSDNFLGEDVPNYLVLDGRVGWKPRENLEIAAGFQNALDDRHPEFGDPIFEAVVPSEVEHRVYASFTYRF